MKRPSYLLRIVAMLGIVSMMFAGVVTTASASAPPSGGAAAIWDGQTWPGLFGGFESDTANGSIACFSNVGSGTDTYVAGGPECDGAQEVYFASVGNGEDFGLGAAQTSVTVQNLDQNDAYVFLYVGNGDGWDQSEYAYLSGGASKTFTAADLGIAEGTTVPVVAAVYHVLLADITCVLVSPETTGPFICSSASEDFSFVSATNVSTAVGVGAFAAGVAKQAVTGDNLPYTTAADTSVSGYNAVSGREVGYFDQLYLPIVQTNCGPGGCWDTDIRVANVGLDANAAVTLVFFPADDGSGSLQTGFQLQALLNVGETWTTDIADWVPSGWVGSVHVYSDDAVVAIADRFKAGTSMWITNTASNAQSESDWQFPGGPANAPYVLFAPDVRTDYNGWNTGINVANTVDNDNDVYIQYFGNNGNAPLAQQRRLAAQGMTYFYNPSQPSQDDCTQPATDVPGCEFIGGAVILSTDPVAVAVDGVKYFGNDANVGQAFSYAATGNAFTNLDAPLVQKGNPATGMGATSGINFLNPNSDGTVVTTTWVNPSGFGASNFADSIVLVPGFSTGFVYTMFNLNLPNGFYGSAIVQSTLPIAATTANVDYQVSGDGTTVWNLYNPCGFFRQAGECVYEAPITAPGADSTITKTVTCPDCTIANTEVAGAVVSYSGTDTAGFDHNGTGMTGANGAATFAVPAGDYTFTLESLPSVYDQSSVGETDDVSVAAGNTSVVDDIVTQATVTKIVDTNVPGITVCIYDAATTIPTDITDTDFAGTGDLPDGALFCAVADASGNATFEGLEAGVDYVAVAQGLGYDQMTDAFNIGTPGTTETNLITPALPGALTKAIDLGDLNLGVAFGDYSLNADVIFCRADLMTIAPDGTVTDPTQCDDWTTDDAAVAHGGYDTFVGGSDFIFEFNSEVAPGDYVICSSAFVTGDFDNDPLTPDDSIGYDFMCESTSDNQVVDGVDTTGPITVISGEETYVTNDLAALATGQLDVYVTQVGVAASGVTVNLYENGDNDGDGTPNELIDSTTTDANGAASFDVPAGSYTVTAVGGVGFESQDASLDYSVSDDASNGGVDDTLTINTTYDVSIDQAPTT